jgi:hypothetical protein
VEPWIQIVLQRFESVNQVINSFDLGCCSVALDGQQVWFNDRSKFSYEHGVNVLDLTNRRYTYEKRIQKYFRRGWPIVLPQHTPAPTPTPIPIIPNKSSSSSSRHTPTHQLMQEKTSKPRTKKRRLDSDDDDSDDSDDSFDDTDGDDHEWRQVVFYMMEFRAMIKGRRYYAHYIQVKKSNGSTSTFYDETNRHNYCITEMTLENFRLGRQNNVEKMKKGANVMNAYVFGADLFDIETRRFIYCDVHLDLFFMATHALRNRKQNPMYERNFRRTFGSKLADWMLKAVLRNANINWRHLAQQITQPIEETLLKHVVIRIKNEHTPLQSNLTPISLQQWYTPTPIIIHKFKPTQTNSSEIKTSTPTLNTPQPPNGNSAKPMKWVLRQRRTGSDEEYWSAVPVTPTTTLPTEPTEKSKPSAKNTKSTVSEYITKLMQQYPAPTLPKESVNEITTQKIDEKKPNDNDDKTQWKKKVMQMEADAIIERKKRWRERIDRLQERQKKENLSTLEMAALYEAEITDECIEHDRIREMLLAQGCAIKKSVSIQTNINPASTQPNIVQEKKNVENITSIPASTQNTISTSAEKITSSILSKDELVHAVMKGIENQKQAEREKAVSEKKMSMLLFSDLAQAVSEVAKGKTLEEFLTSASGTISKFLPKWMPNEEIKPEDGALSILTKFMAHQLRTFSEKH